MFARWAALIGFNHRGDTGSVLCTITAQADTGIYSKLTYATIICT